MKKTYLLFTAFMACVFLFTGCKKNELVLIYDANGGGGSMENQVFEEGVQQVLNANEFTRTGYIFKGWNTKADGSGSSYRDKQLVRLYANLGLYAQWVDPAGGGTPCPGIPTMNDIDGNTYNTVQIGSQCWMRENLKTTKYATGENILLVTDNQVWYYLNEGAMCYYNNDASNAHIYGALYNGYIAGDEDLCPEGWHVPTNDEWNILANELGGANIAGYKMKTVYDWEGEYGYNGNGSNESGFSAFPAGACSGFGGGFFNMRYQAYFWSSTSSDWRKIMRGLSSNSKELWSSGLENNYGFSVRCIKD